MSDLAIGHTCFMPSCERVASSTWPLCGSCTRVLPIKYKDRIARAYAPGMTWESASGGMRKEIAAAYSWVLEAFGNPAEKHDPKRWERLVRWVREKDAARAAARATGEPIKKVPRCPSPECPCQECVVEYGCR